MPIRWEVAKYFAEEYRKILRDMKRRGIDTSNAPPEVQQADLAMLQNAQMVYWLELKERKNKMKTQNDH